MANENKNDVKEVQKLPTTAELLAEIQLRKLQKEEAAEAEAVSQQKAAKEAGLRAVREGEQKKKLDQDACHHQKPNGAPSIAGQRLHSHKNQFICLFCQKEWIDGALPAHLRIDSNLIGGPNF